MNDKFTLKFEEILKYHNKYIEKEDLNKIVDFNKIISFKKGDLISAEHKGFLLLSGLIRGYYLDIDGNDITHVFIFEGSTYGADFLTTDKPYICNFEALEECIAVELNRTFLVEEFKTNQGLLMWYIHMLEKSLKRKILREVDLVTKNATERYLNLKKEYPNIDKRVSQAHIASYLGISPVSLSRIRRFTKEEN
ncbi:MAG: Crp/Fnr family transcriptional regulator [Firmicutes bacterium]|nr:Crp/Fnr family transcriptional regulator [Bacillota bacterium]